MQTSDGQSDRGIASPPPHLPCQDRLPPGREGLLSSPGQSAGLHPDFGGSSISLLDSRPPRSLETPQPAAQAPTNGPRLSPGTRRPSNPDTITLLTGEVVHLSQVGSRPVGPVQSGTAALRHGPTQQHEILTPGAGHRPGTPGPQVSRALASSGSFPRVRRPGWVLVLPPEN